MKKLVLPLVNMVLAMLGFGAGTWYWVGPHFSGHEIPAVIWMVFGTCNLIDYFWRQSRE